VKSARKTSAGISDIRGKENIRAICEGKNVPQITQITQTNAEKDQRHQRERKFLCTPVELVRQKIGRSYDYF